VSVDVIGVVDVLGDVDAVGDGIVFERTWT